jgi:glycosyltransferase involved in cell wall biosynthesis
VKLAIIGARSIPARWGGFDTVVSRLAPRLARLGYDVTVYCQKRYALPERPPVYEGVNLRYVSSLRSKSLEAVSYEALCALDAIRRDFDAVYVLGLRASAVHLLHRLRGRPVIMNTDGFDWQRRKWGRIARAYLRFSEAVAARFVATHLICDSRAVQPYYAKTYGRETTYIGYGADPVSGLNGNLIGQYGLKSDDYYLVVARIEPENNIDVAIREHAASGVSKPLVVVGAANYLSRYEAQIKAIAKDGQVRFLGGIYTPGHLEHLYANAYAYIHGHEVGGTNPALLQAMGQGRAVAAIDVPFNREVLGASGLFYDKREGAFAAVIRRLDQDAAAARVLGNAAAERARERYDWDDVAGSYDRLFRSLRDPG